MNKNMCPMLKRTCLEQDCSWWVTRYGICVIPFISDSLEMISEAMEEMGTDYDGD